MPANESRSGKQNHATEAETKDEDKKMPARARIQRPNQNTIPETHTAATSRILPSLDDLVLTEEEKVIIEDHVIPWLRDNDFTMDDDGTFSSDSIIPPTMQQWLIGRGARLAAVTPTGAIPAANVTANPPLAAIEVDAQGDTVEDPIVIDESTSNSDNESAEGTDKTT